MLFNDFIAWIHWDPSRFLFTIPYIDRPVAWYGIFFATGFILGFFILVPIISRKICQSGQLSERDIADWPLLVNYFKQAQGKHPLSPLLKKLPNHAKEQVNLLKFKQEPDPALKAALLKALNLSLGDLSLNIDRRKLEFLCPKALHKATDLSFYLTDRITWFVVAGTVVGARLGHVFFYEWPRYQQNPVDILKVWEGGLASHGGVIGILIALCFYRKMIQARFPELTYIDLLDALSIPSALAAFFIRIGNFFNQEITGPVTTVPWAVVFGHPLEGGDPLPRHPTQLYEAACYLIIFIVLYTMWKSSSAPLKKGRLIGLFMVLVFGSRFFIEFFKVSSSLVIDESWLQAGQILSIPFILFGAALLYASRHPPLPKARHATAK